jgi:alkyl hydroperoxide reductase subunit AhpF
MAPGPYNRVMGLLSAQDEKVLTEHLSAIEKPVTLLLFTQTIGGSESGPVAKQVLDEVARLNDKITVEEKNFILDLDDRAKYGIDQSPAIVFLGDGEDTRMRMFGAPTGYEFVGLVEAILIAGTGRLDLEDNTLKLIAGVENPMKIQVFSTPT